MKNIFCHCIAVILFPLCVLSATTPDAIQTDLITRSLNQWSVDFNAKKVGQVCDLFAKDLIASYPGTKDKNYDQMCGALRTAINDPHNTYEYDQPQIEQIIVAGDVAIVRLIWTLTVSTPAAVESVARNDASDLVEAQREFIEAHSKPVRIEKVVIKEKGIDVFKRQTDGHWKIMISYAYPLQSSS